MGKPVDHSADLAMVHQSRRVATIWELDELRPWAALCHRPCHIARQQIGVLAPQHKDGTADRLPFPPHVEAVEPNRSPNAGDAGVDQQPEAPVRVAGDAVLGQVKPFSISERTERRQDFPEVGFRHIEVRKRLGEIPWVRLVAPGSLAECGC